MRRHLPYGEMDQDFNDLQLPDEEVSWQKMRELLDKDEKGERRVLPLFFRSFSGLGILLLVGITVIWLLVGRERTRIHGNQIKDDSSSYATSPRAKNNENLANGGGGSSEALISNVKNNTAGTFTDEKVDVTIRSKRLNETTKKLSSGLAVKKNEADGRQRYETVPVMEVNSDSRATHLKTSPTNMTSNFPFRMTEPPHQGLSSPASFGLIQYNNLAVQIQGNPARKRLSLIAGLGIQQQIPIAGQSLVSYSYNGTKGSITDYLPHLYVQLQKEGKWFMEGDFRIGVAQPVAEFPYSQKTTYDAASMNITVITMRLMKTYYHELSSSFNYFLIPNVSLGAGGMYSRFDGAVTEQETNTSNVLTLATNSVKEIIPVKQFTDSFLYRNQLRVLMQAGYQWKKFSFSLRYTRDIQPYIKYTRPDGTVTEEKNQSLQFLLRFKLWQSRRF